MTQLTSTYKCNAKSHHETVTIFQRKI